MDSESKIMRIKALKAEVQKKTKALKRMEGILKEHIQKEHVPVDNMLQDDLLAIMDKHEAVPGINYAFTELHTSVLVQCFRMKLLSSTWDGHIRISQARKCVQ
jgi:ribonuclease D